MLKYIIVLLLVLAVLYNYKLKKTRNIIVENFTDKKSQFPTIAESQIGTLDSKSDEVNKNDYLNNSKVSSGYDSMFDTKLIASWKTRNDIVKDGDIVNINSKIADNLKINNTINKNNKEEVKVNKSKDYPFSNLIECQNKNYMTAQNFWEFYYKYPIVPPEGSMPLGSNINDFQNYVNPLLNVKIINGNKDGGHPLPDNTFFNNY
jgi:hypothetical protein